MNKPYNPLAFPCAHEGGQQGMTLRDYFAAKALQGLIACVVDSDGEAYPNATLAEFAYAVADAMMAERAK